MNSLLERVYMVSCQFSFPSTSEKKHFSTLRWIWSRSVISCFCFTVWQWFVWRLTLWGSVFWNKYCREDYKLFSVFFKEFIWDNVYEKFFVLLSLEIRQRIFQFCFEAIVSVSHCVFVSGSLLSVLNVIEISKHSSNRALIYNIRAFWIVVDHIKVITFFFHQILCLTSTSFSYKYWMLDTEGPLSYAYQNSSFSHCISLGCLLFIDILMQSQDSPSPRLY